MASDAEWVDVDNKSGQGAPVHNVSVQVERAQHLRQCLRPHHQSEITLSFVDVSYNVISTTKDKEGKLAKTKRQILKDVTGAAHTGELMAIIGPSGAGKSTLLDTLAGRIHQNSLEGTVLLNNSSDIKQIKRISAYVHQDDQLFAMLTVWETLMFSAGVRLPASVTPAEKRTRVEELIEQLGLERVAHTFIGNENIRGVSGGERRRVSIGVDIIHDPQIAFLDEPTSGLDSTSAFFVMEKLQRIAKAGSLVVCTIHQPSFRILGLLDKLMVLARGQVAYLGPPGDLPEFLEGVGVAIPAHANCAEVVLDLVEGRSTADGDDEDPQQPPQQQGTGGSGGGGPVGVIDLLVEKQARSATTAAIRERAEIAAATGTGEAATEQQQAGGTCLVQLDRLLLRSGSGRGKEKDDLQEQEPEQGQEKFATSAWVNLQWLAWRAFLNIYRTPTLFVVRMVTIAVLGCVMATLFIRPNKGTIGARNFINVIVFSLCTVYYSANDALSAFIEERHIYIRESSHYAYRTSMYVVANMGVFLPFLLLQALMYSLLCWWSIGLAGGSGGLTFFCIVMFLAFFTANSMVCFLSAVVPNLVVGSTAALFTTSCFLLLSGFFITSDEIPGYWVWIHYISYFKYPFDALSQAQFDRDSCYVDSNPLPEIYFSIDGTRGSTCYLTGRDIVRDLGVGKINKWVCCLILVCMGLAYRLAFYISLLRSSRIRRR